MPKSGVGGRWHVRVAVAYFLTLPVLSAVAIVIIVLMLMMVVAAVGVTDGGLLVAHFDLFAVCFKRQLR